MLHFQVLPKQISSTREQLQCTMSHGKQACLCSGQVHSQPLVFPSKKQPFFFLPEPLRRARSWNCSRLALDPGTRLSLHKNLRVLLTIILKWVNYCLLQLRKNCFGPLPRDWLIKCLELIVGLRISNGLYRSVIHQPKDNSSYFDQSYFEFAQVF